MTIDSLNEFGHFFDQAVTDGLVILLAIPGAAIGCAESGSGLNQKVDAGHVEMEKVSDGGVKTIARSPPNVSFGGSG